MFPIFLLTYQGNNPSRHLSRKRDIRNPGLGEEDVKEKEGEEQGAEDAPAKPPVHAELHPQHEVEISGEVDFSRRACIRPPAQSAN